MKKNDTVTLFIVGIIIIGAILGGYYLLFPTDKKDKESSIKKPEYEVVEVPAEIDEATYEIVSNLSDYGKPDLDNIGKPDLFSGF